MTYDDTLPFTYLITLDWILPIAFWLSGFTVPPSQHLQSHVPFEHSTVPHFTSKDYCYHHRATFEILYLQQHKEQYKKKDTWGMQPLVITIPPYPTFRSAFWIQNLCGNILRSWTYKWIDVSPQCSRMVQSCLVPVSGWSGCCWGLMRQVLGSGVSQRRSSSHHHQ